MLSFISWTGWTKEEWIDFVKKVGRYSLALIAITSVLWGVPLIEALF